MFTAKILLESMKITSFKMTRPKNAIIFIRTHTYSARREVVPNEVSITRLLDVLPVLFTLGVDQNTVDIENPIN